MLINPRRFVIDRDGHYVDFVILMEQSDGSTIPYAYTMKSGETLIEEAPPFNMIIPRWTGNIWEETATPEQIATAEAQKSGTTSEVALPSLDKRVEAVEDALLALVLGGVTGV